MTSLVRVYLLVTAVLTLAGGLAAIYPPFDIANYFRPWMVLVSLPALVVFLANAQPTSARVVSLLIVVTNVALLLFPVLTNTSGRTANKTKPLKVISLNVWYINPDIDRVAEFLIQEQADIVLLQEMHSDHLNAVRDRLRRIYPFIHTCDCRGQVLLSRFPWQVAGGNRLTRTKPALIWARFAQPGRGTYRIVGVHTAYPLQPAIHMQHMQWLAEKLPSSERLIVAGDFNATPWSTQLMRMSARYGLQRAVTFGRSWPSHLLAPLLLIDNVFASNLFKLRASTIGPDVGSDHRPVIVELAIPS